MLSQNFYLVFTRHSAGKIWSSIYVQDTVLHYQINPIRLLCSFLYPILLCSFLYPICLTGTSNENDYLYVENIEVH